MSQVKTSAHRWWKTFLTPGWAIAALLIALFSYFAFTFLAPWQLNKNEQLTERNDHIVEAFDTEPVNYASVVGADGSITADSEWTRVSMTGRYQPENEILLRLRPVDNTPAFQVLTPFAVDNGPTFLINRGWVAATGGGTQVPAFDPAPTNETTLVGMLRLDEGPHPSPPVEDQGYTMVYSINAAQASQATGIDVAPSYIQLVTGQPGALEAIPLPVLETGNHLSYGLQWIAFGVMAPAGLIYFIWAESRERRRFAQEQAQLQAQTQLPLTRQRYGNDKRNHWASDYDKSQQR